MNQRQAKIRLLLVDDHPVVRSGVRSLLADHARIEIVGEAADGREGVCKTRQLVPDVVLMDWRMPQMDGGEATRLLQKEAPRVKVLVFSVSDDRQSIRQIVQSGAQGCVQKEAPPEELVQAIETVGRGEAFFSPEMAQAALNQCVATSPPGTADSTAKLTDRETQVITMLSEGLSNRQIADELGISVRTVEAHRERVMRKLDIHSVVGLTRFAIAKGLTTV